MTTARIKLEKEFDALLEREREAMDALDAIRKEKHRVNVAKDKLVLEVDLSPWRPSLNDVASKKIAGLNRGGGENNRNMFPSYADADAMVRRLYLSLALWQMHDNLYENEDWRGDVEREYAIAIDWNGVVGVSMYGRVPVGIPAFRSREDAQRVVVQLKKEKLI